MENGDLELGVADMIQERVQRFLYRVKTEQIRIHHLPSSIYMVPRTLRDVSPSSFSPRVVSIGPLHREDENVRAFEGQKATYLINLMSRMNPPQEIIMKSCMEKVYDRMEEIKACYELTKTYRDDEIAEMMVLDACFILGFLLEIFEFVIDSNLEDLFHFTTDIAFDLVLLENQIPFFVLNDIFQCTILKLFPNMSLPLFLSPILILTNLFDRDLEFDNISIDSTHHILSLLHECYKPQQDGMILKGSLSSRVHSAMHLDKAGVKFKPNKSPTWLLGMEVKPYRFPCFYGSWCKHTLRMPVFKVHDFTELVLRNLIAYEHRLKRTHMYITSYAYAMDSLVNTQEDVAMLVDSNVLDNNMGSNDEAANMINNVCKDVSQGYFFYTKEWEILDKYCNSYWPKHIARMRKAYFSSPWNVIALVAGIVLFALTVVQTIFTIKSAGSKE